MGSWTFKYVVETDKQSNKLIRVKIFFGLTRYYVSQNMYTHNSRGFFELIFEKKSLLYTVQLFCNVGKGRYNISFTYPTVNGFQHQAFPEYELSYLLLYGNSGLLSAWTTNYAWTSVEFQRLTVMDKKDKKFYNRLLININKQWESQLSVCGKHYQ